MYKLIVVAIFCGVIFGNLSAQEVDDSPSSTITGGNKEENSIFNMSIEELMNLEVLVGSNSKIKKSNIPVSLTTITAQDIKISSARNIYDLLEIYVPSASWVTHGEGPKLGLRGIISDRNNKYLVRLNGVIMNQKAHVGVVSEMENWDLNDIYKIEIIRGPGSVTYGPGAILGVIDITTKDSSTSAGTKVSTNYVGKYNSKGLALSHGINNEKFKLFAYGSIQSTSGYSPDAYVMNSKYQAGYVGKGVFGISSPGSPVVPVNEYFTDLKNKPQLKFHLQGSIGKGLGFFTRYTNSGSTLGGNGSKVRFQKGYASASDVAAGLATKIGNPLYQDNFENGAQAANQHFTASVFKTWEINDKLSLTGRVTYDNECQARVRGISSYTYDVKLDSAANNANLLLAKSDNLRQWQHRFSEQEISADLLANYSFTDKIKAALGGTFTRNSWGAYWGDNKGQLRMGEANAVKSIPANILSDINSQAIGDKSLTALGSVADSNAIYVGNGWNTNTIALYADVKIDLHPMFHVLVSGRYDKDTYSRSLFSPRVALISEINSKNVIKLIGQQSFRMNTATQLYIQNLKGTTSAPEKLQGLELIYNSIQGKYTNIAISGFYNQIDLLGWNTAQGEVSNLGKQKIAGIELEVLYKSEKLTFGASHSLTKQISWDLDDKKDANGKYLVNAAGASYSDYRQVFTYIDDNMKSQTDTLFGVGNSINNLSSNVTKLYINYSPFKKLTLHLDTRAYWNFKGGKDGLTVLENAANAMDSVSSKTQKAKMLAMVADARSQHVYNTDIRMNFSVAYAPIKGLEITLFVNNLTSINGNKRYNLDAGNVQAYPARVAFVKEPTSIGFKLAYEF